ncbi:hypothetical protein [Aeoliella sp. SH292]|uniref:hypothetical protein n=1 Tax=Aeoliella sp. SH292 TaxID=3454464 RepID=UPI003F9B0D70
MNPYESPSADLPHLPPRPQLRSSLLIAGIVGLLLWLVAGAASYVPEVRWIGNTVSFGSLVIGILCLVVREMLKR